MTATNTTPEGFRTAAYLATRARLDARKTAKRVSCTPPNTQCGGRCIPPSWDCRIKGEGPDPHLRAVKTDPLGGLANIERGVRRVTRGVTKGSFSEVEGGKRAIIRGTVKIAPGNLQQKKELQAKLENRTRAIGIGLAVVTGGLGIHAILMRGNTFGYRSGLGRDINNATRAGVARVLDAVPLLGVQRAATRAAVGADLGRTVGRLNLGATAGPEVAGPAGIPRLSRLSASDEHSHSALKQALRKFNEETLSRAGGNLTNWDRGHRAEFWKVERTVSGISLPGSPSPEKISVFAEPSGEEFLATQFGLPASARGSRDGIKAGIQGRLREERLNLVSLAKQRGFRTVNSPDGMERIASADLSRFIRDVSGKAPTTFYATRANVEEHIRNVLTTAPSTYTNTLYAKSVRSFDSYYKTIAGDLSRIPGATSVGAAGSPRINRLTAGSDDLVKNADNYRSAFLAREMNIRSEMAGPAHAELVRTRYYHSKVVGTAKSTYVVPDRLALSAASELSGRSVTSRAEAIRLLNQTDGFANARLIARATPRAGTGAAKQASLTTAARSIMARAGNENMTLEAALRQARSEQRGDSVELPLRLRVYLEARRDLKEGSGLGKPCGASHIPKAHECRKGKGATAQATSPKNGGRPKAATIAAVAGGTALAVGGLLVYKKRSTIIPSLSQKTINGMSSAQVKAGLDKLPAKFQEPARKLVGGAKNAAAHMALKAQGGQIRAVDIKNNFSTWQMPNGTQLSVGSVGDSLLTFGAERKGNVSKFPQYGLGFTIDSSYDAKGGMPGAQAKQLIRTTKAMYKAQLDMLPENAVMFAVPHKADGKGGKRKSIYEGMGFKPIPGLKTDRLWALKNQGQFAEIPDSQMDYMASLIRGDEADELLSAKP